MHFCFSLFLVFAYFWCVTIIASVCIDLSMVLLFLNKTHTTYAHKHMYTQSHAHPHTLHTLTASHPPAQSGEKDLSSASPSPTPPSSYFSLSQTSLLSSSDFTTYSPSSSPPSSQNVTPTKGRPQGGRRSKTPSECSSRSSSVPRSPILDDFRSGGAEYSIAMIRGHILEFSQDQVREKAHSHYLLPSLSLSRSHTHTLTLALTRTHTYTHTHPHSHSHSHTHTPHTLHTYYNIITYSKARFQNLNLFRFY